MASFSVPCPKVSPLISASCQSTQRRHCIASIPRSDTRSTPALRTKDNFQGRGRSQSDVYKVCAQLSEVAVDKTSNGPPAIEGVPPAIEGVPPAIEGVPPAIEGVPPAIEGVPIVESDKQEEVPDASSISTFMNQVTDLVKFVDSKDIVELQLKQMDCEIIIRKKEALPQSIPASAFIAPPHAHQSISPAPASGISAPALPAPTKPESSHPPFKSPMPGNFYRSPAPETPPFVKVGDKVIKGQVLCIVEAMKLMNEIQAEDSGTIEEILVENGTSVSKDTPLFIIAP